MKPYFWEKESKTADGRLAGIMVNSEAYRGWTQDAAELNEREAWPAELFPEATWHYFKQAGCLISSLAIMLRRFGIEKEQDPEQFNPWILNERLIEAGAFTPGADLIVEDIKKLYPLEYVGVLPYSRKSLVRLIEMGNPFLITVPGVRGARHFVVPDELTDDDLRIIDPGWSKPLLSEFDVILELRVFRKSRTPSGDTERCPDFDLSFPRSGNPAEDMTNAALAHEGKTGLELGYDYHWCASFLSDLAKTLGQGRAIPWSALVTALHSGILASGGKPVTDEPRPGDLAFINWDRESVPHHVEIVYGTDNGFVLTIGGNSGKDTSSPFVSCVYRHKLKTVITDILRPAYE